VARVEPKWLSAADVIYINRTLVSQTGEPFSVLDQNLLGSAVSAPINLYHYGNELRLVALAAHLLGALGRNHPFQQGNKRTAFVAAVHFLESNGAIFAMPDSLEAAERIEGLIIGTYAESAIVEFLERWTIL
jgi:death on curing protein